jgi:ribosomal protein S18 acetylase RimI-like enzyme
VALETRDRKLLERLLRREPVWGGYGLGDLGDPVLFARTRWFLSDPDGAAVALLYAAGDHVSLLTYGDPERVAGLVPELPLPERFHAHLPDAHYAALAGRLAGEVAPYVRLGLTPDALRPAPAPPGAEVATLSAADLPAVEALYAHYPENWFEPWRLEHGGYLGVRLDGRLAAVGGTHVAAPATRTAALGDIVTDPVARGRGLATLLTHALCAHHTANGIDLVVLNVKADNAAARRAYEKVGFGHPVPHVEGHDLRRV